MQLREEHDYGMHTEDYNHIADLMNKSLNADTIDDIDQAGITFVSTGTIYIIYPNGKRDIRLEFLQDTYPVTYRECIDEPEHYCEAAIRSAMKEIDPKALCAWLNNHKERWVLVE